MAAGLPDEGISWIILGALRPGNKGGVMKKLRISHSLSFCVFFIFLVIPSLAGAASVKLAWDPSTEEDLAGYKIYYGYDSRNYNTSIDVGKTTTFQVTGLEYDQTYYFAVTAYNTSGLESDYSNEISYIPTEYDYNTVTYNPGMEDGETYPDHWQTYDNDLDRESGWREGVAHSGYHSIKIENTTGTNAGWQGQTVYFSDPYPKNLILGGWAMAEDVAEGGIFAIVFYIEFEDGSHTWYWEELRFRPGTHDWENIESTVTFDKGVKQIRPYCLLYSTTGTAWFDDVYAILEGDSDGDGLQDEEEEDIGTDPNNPDTDYDGMPDGWEVKYGLDPVFDDALEDLDGDEYTNIEEYNNHTDPSDPDSKPHDWYNTVTYNPSMENGEAYPDHWQTYDNDLDRESGWREGVAHSGYHSIKIENTTGTNAGWQGQTVYFSDPYPKNLILGGWAMAEDVAEGGIFAINFYIEFEDGSHTWYWEELRFRPGTHDWENIESTVTFDKGVKQIRPYCLLYSTTGTAWFDDVYAIVQ